MSGRGSFGGSSREEDMVMGSMMVKLTMSINKQCFVECVTSFKEGTLSSSEQGCIKSCAQRQSGAFAAMNDISGELSKRGQGMF